mmetsp:Transcript_27543/g.45183  ORF Transcript_27543/g.45183 Transcript_27543/m.45183 type:complete len:170 (-) Transcript_27543:128-637(-)
MINILSKNDSKKNTDAYPMNVVKEMLQNVIANRNKILEKVGIERAELYNDMEAALSRAKCNTKSSKLTHAEGLVDVWLVLKNIPSLVYGSDGVATQTKSLDTYIGAMENLELCTTNDINELTKQIKKNVSRPMPPGEAERKYLAPGLPVNRTEFPSCPNSNCNHQSRIY